MSLTNSLLAEPKRHPLWYMAAAMIVVASSVLSYVELNTDGESGKACTERLGKPLPRPVKPGGSAKVSGLVAVGASAQRDPAAQLKFNFGASRRPLVRRQTFRVPAGVNRAAIVAQVAADFSEANSSNVINRDNVLTQVSRLSVDRRLVSVAVCVDPHGADPGTYSGATLVNAPRARNVTPTPLPASITVRDDQKILAMLAVLAGIIAAATLRARADIQQTKGLTRSQYVYSLSFLVMVVGGQLGGIAAYSKLYATVSDANLDPLSLIALGGAGFTATLAAKSLTELSGALSKRSGGGD